MTEEKSRERKSLLTSKTMDVKDMDMPLDNRLSYNSNENQPTKKLLFNLFKDITSTYYGQQELSCKDLCNSRIKEDALLKVKGMIRIQETYNLIGIKSINDQTKSLKQMNQTVNKPSKQLEVVEETSRKELIGSSELDVYHREKGDSEKEEVPEIIKCFEGVDDDHEKSDIILKEDSEEKGNNSDLVFISKDYQYVSWETIYSDKVSEDYLETEKCFDDCDSLRLKENIEDSEKFSSNDSSLHSIDYEKPVEFAKDANDNSDESQKSQIDFNGEIPDDSFCLVSILNSISPQKCEEKSDEFYLINELSLITKCIITIGDNVDWNIMSPLQSIETSSFNAYCEDKRSQAAYNMNDNNSFTKEWTKKSPMSMDNRHIKPFSSQYDEPDTFDPWLSSALHKLFDESDCSSQSNIGGSPGPKRKRKGPRGRSGSHNKPKGRRQGGRHRSRKHGNNRGSGRGGGAAAGGGGGDGGTNSIDGAGSGGEGGGGDEDGGGDEKDRRNIKENAERHSDDDDEEDEEDESDEDNKKEDEKEEETTNNLPNSTRAQIKTKDKDLTHLLVGDSPPELLQSGETEGGAFSILHESESLNLPSLLHELSEQDAVNDETVLEHSCICMDTLCDIIGAATGKDYVPQDSVLLPLNSCLTILVHNMSLAYEGDESVLECQNCPILSGLFKHLAKCDKSSPCAMCLQGYNLILHHAKICIEADRPAWPLSRADLCFKLCQTSRWSVQGLIGEDKIYNKMMIKKYSDKILTLPCEQRVESSETVKCGGEPQLQEPQAVEERLIQPDVRPKCQQATASAGRVAAAGVGVDVKQSNPFRSAGGHPHHTSLSRKPSNSRRNVIPPSITEHDENEEEEKEEEHRGVAQSADETAEAIARRLYEQKVNEEAHAFHERDYLYSLPQGRINDQTQFNSLVSHAIGVKGVGEMVYSTVAQLRLVANFWEQKKHEFKSTGKRPYQRAEEGVIINKYKSKFRILGTRYQLDYQWHKLTALGSGMTGRCYLAMDSETGYRFCVKKINLVDYKKEELDLWADLNHPNIVTLYGAMRHSDMVYFFTEYIDGGDLGHCINEHKSGGERLSHWLALNYFQQLLNVLKYLESQNVLHEDIKADNILLRADTFQIVLTDFGLCHRLQKAVELKNKAPAGTATHFSPEKAASMGHGFPACVWACVCVLVHMLSGQQPWQKYLKKVDYLNFTIFMKPPPLDDVPDNIRSIVKDLIAQGFTKDSEKRPNAHQLLQHEAFNIINQEAETYFSTLASAFHSNIGATSKAQKDKGSTVKNASSVRGGQNRDLEEEVSLYEINLPQHSTEEAKSVPGVVQDWANQEHNNEESVGKIPQVLTVDKTEEEQEESYDITELEGAVGGETTLEDTGPSERGGAYRINAAVEPAQNNLSGPTSTAENNVSKDAQEPLHLSDEVKQMNDGRLPALDILLEESDEPTRSFFTDNTSINLNIPVTLEVFNPPATSMNSNSVASDQIPNLSIFFDPYAWGKDFATASSNKKDVNNFTSSSGEIDSAEMYAPGMETGIQQPIQSETYDLSLSHNILSHNYLQKKPPDLKLDVQPRLKHQGSQEKLMTTRKSTSTATASSQGSSVYFPGSAASTAKDDFKDLLEQKQNEENEEKPKDEEEDKTKVNRYLDKLRANINLENFDGLKLTLYDQNKEMLFYCHISAKDLEKPVKDHIYSFNFKNKIKTPHFELMTMEMEKINYSSKLKSSKLMVVAQPETRQCWCARCQF